MSWHYIEVILLCLSAISLTLAIIAISRRQTPVAPVNPQPSAAMIRPGRSSIDLMRLAHTTLIDRLYGGLVVLDAQHQIVDLNSAALSMLNIEQTVARVIGSSIDEFIPCYTDVLRLPGELAHEQLITLDSQSGQRFIEVRTSPLNDTDGRRVGSLVVLHDVSDRLAVEAALLEANRRWQRQLTEIDLLHAELVSQALHDPLTGAFNRRYLETVLEKELGRAERHNLVVGLVILDIDYFKQINDTFGHRGGDIVLQALADMLRAQTRREDAVCRYGGEEFVVVMPGATAGALHARVANWLTDFRAMRFPELPTLQGVTFSAGVAAYPEHGLDSSEMLTVADRALYVAKEAGRNQVVLGRVREYSL